MTQKRWALRLWALLGLSLAAGAPRHRMIRAPNSPGTSSTNARCSPASASRSRRTRGRLGAAAQPDRLYQLQLQAAGQVTLALPPGSKKTASDSSYAGLARLRLQQAGNYRVSVDQSVWIDIVADGKMIDSADFQGRPGCLAPHKIVQYPLPAGRELLLQLSGAPGADVRLTITATPSG